MTANQPYRILSCDGGGIRGLVSAVVLERLEQKLGSPLHKHFDLIAGTSTGSLIACGIASGHTVTEIKNFYINRGIDIFPKFWDVAESLLSRAIGGYTQPIYDGKGLEMVLQEIFAERPFKNLLKPTVVTSYDTYNRQAVVFKNTKLAHENIPVWEICRSSAAAPVAFPAYEMRDKDFLKDLESNDYKIPLERGIPLIDGGVIANNPAMCAIAERIRWNEQPPLNPKWIAPGQENVPLENIVIASFGTGQPTAKKISVKEAKGWGAAEWANPFNGIPILDILFDGSADAVDYITQQLLLKDNYFRFQPLLTKKSPAFNANEEYLMTLENMAKSFFDDQVKDADVSRPITVDQKLDKLVEILK